MYDMKPRELFRNTNREYLREKLMNMKQTVTTKI
jgi:hypothetical protein